MLGVWPGGVKAQTQGEVGGSGWGVGWCPGPHLGGVQAHTWEVGDPGPHQEVSPGPGPGCVSQHALRQTPPPPQKATAASGMHIPHPTGMHCSHCGSLQLRSSKWFLGSTRLLAKGTH